MNEPYKHDSTSNELTASKAHYAMKWIYRLHNVILLVTGIAIILAPKKDKSDTLLAAAAVTTCGLGIWINGEAGQWHQRAAEEHLERATKNESL